jgi:protein phosphatase
MGATVVAAWLHASSLSLAHVGDSRAYLLRGAALKQLTRDHSLAAERARRGFITSQEAHTSTLQNVLLRALGSADKLEVDTQDVPLQQDDIVVLCTDGLTRMVCDPEIAGALLTHDGAQSAADRLVQLANDHGGKDNVTAVVLHIGRNRDGLLGRLRDRITRPAKNASGHCEGSH